MRGHGTPLVILLSALSGSIVASAAPGDSRLIRASASLMRLGSFHIVAAATYASALESLGPSSSCRLAKNGVLAPSADHAVAYWKALSVRIELRTYGAMPGGKNGCTSPSSIHVSTVRVTGGEWHTTRGLRVGDTVAKLTLRYPAAKRANDLPGWYHHGYWLVTRPVGGYEGIGGLRRTVPVLVAETSKGRVFAFVFVVDGEGE